MASLVRMGRRSALFVLLVACAPAAGGQGPPGASDTALRLGAPPSIDVTLRDEVPAQLVSRPIFSDPSPALREERFIAILRRSLRRRGLGAEVAAGPMAVVTSRDHPDAEVAIDGPEAGDLAAAWPSGAALVATAGGRWWVWDYGSTAPADALARELAARVGTRGLSGAQQSAAGARPIGTGAQERRTCRCSA